MRYAGNVMIDTLVHHLPDAVRRADLRRSHKPFALVTLHHPSDVDQRDTMADITAAITAAITKVLTGIASQVDVVFPVTLGPEIDGRNSGCGNLDQS